MSRIIEEIKLKAKGLITAGRTYRPKKADIKFLLQLLWLIPVLVLVLVIKLNWMPFGGSVSFTIDVGTDDTKGAAVLTGPFDRISNESVIDGVSVRQLEGGLVYFTLDNNALGKASQVEVTARFSGEFPNSSAFMVGAKEKGKTSYLWKDIYSPFYAQVSNLPLVTKNDLVTIYATDTENPPDFIRVEEFTGAAPLGSVVASNNPGFSVEQTVAPYELGGIDIMNLRTSDSLLSNFVYYHDEKGQVTSDTVLLGHQDFYFHTDGGSVDITVGKRDRNYLKGLDNIYVTVYSLDWTVVASQIISDDFNMTGDRVQGPEQYGHIVTGELEAGTYRLEVKSARDDADFIIIYLSINCGELVTEGPLYLAGNTYVGKDPGPMWAWCYLAAAGEIRFNTSVVMVPQIVKVYGVDGVRMLNMNLSDTWFSTGTLQPGIYRIKVSKGDIIMDAPQGCFAFTRDSLFISSLTKSAYEGGWLTIDNALRGGHTFWTYVENGVLQMEVSKQDLNWTQGADALSIDLYSFDGILLGNASIPDDGTMGNSSAPGPVQSGFLSVDGLEAGAYRIELAGGDDFLIRELRINQDKLVVSDSVYLAGVSPVYLGEGSVELGGVGLYGQSFGPRQLTLRTSHDEGLQQVAVVGQGYTSSTNVNAGNTSYRINAYAGPYCLIVPKQDIKVQLAGYLSFTPDSFFYPQRCKVIDLQYDMSWIQKNVDYVVMDYGGYMVPANDQGWLIGRVQWDAEDLDIVDNKLTFCINVPHLAQTAYANSTVSIDWINIKLKAEPFWRR